MAITISAESFDSFDFAFDELAEKLDAGGLWAGVKQIFNLKDSDVYSHLSSIINALRFWNYLIKLLICIQKCSDADKVVQNWDSGFMKIEAAFNEIEDNMRSICRNKTISKRPMEAFNVLKVLEEKIGRVFMLEIREALNHLSNSPLEWKWNHPLLALRHCREILVCIKLILECIRQECVDNSPFVNTDEEQKVIEFLVRVTSLLNFLQHTPRQEDVHSIFFPNDDDMINNFVTHLSSMAVRTASQSFRYWINRKVDPDFEIVGLLELQHGIDLVSPHFLELILRFLRTLHVISPDYLLSYFARYILHPNYFDFENKLETLILFVINELEENPSHSLVTEIKVILPLVVLDARGLLRYHSPFELWTNICCLNAEVLLKQQLNCSGTISLRDLKEISDLISYLGEFSDRPQQQETIDEKRILMFLVELAGEIFSLRQSFSEKKITQNTVRISLFKLVLKIVILRAEFSCMELLKFLDSNANDSTMGIGKDGIEAFVEGLNLFKDFVTNSQMEMTTKAAELIFTQIEASARGITTLCYSLEIENITEEIIEKLMLSFFYQLDKMKVVKAKLEEFCPAIPSSGFPKIGGMGFFDFLLENLRDLLDFSPDSISLVKHLIERIRVDLEVSRCFLMKLETEHLESVYLARRVMDLAYEVDCIIDSIEVGNGDHWQHLRWLQYVIEKIRLINIHATNTCGETSRDAQISNQTISRDRKPEIGELVVCIRDDEQAVIDLLMRGTNNRDIISIVGLPGIGKTTLAKKVYNDPNITHYFCVRAWCSVSQVYAKRELLLDILCDVARGLPEDVHQMTNEDFHQMTDEELESKLCKLLKGKRYLIVLDDVWDTGAWNSLYLSFPDHQNGSRVLMTTRLRDVALKAKSSRDPYYPRLFTDDESWKLLEMKLFHGGCPEELLEVGKDIAKNCKGLPLAIVAIAGLLLKIERKQDAWKKIVGSLTTQIIDDPQNRCKDILQLSYNHLPDYLKACFLYFGAFLGNKDIPVCKLIRLWIAEGFIPRTMLKSSEDLAEDYLLDLIGRSLVTASKIGSDGRVKACNLHDLLRDLCLSKANEENFLQLITGCDEPYASFTDLDFGTDYIDYYPPNPVKYEKHRVCICLNRKHFVKSSPSGPFTRSLIFFATRDQYPRHPYDISFIPENFKLLKVLDLESINMGTSFPTGIELLVQLRYVAGSGDIDFIPPVISKLHKLETFIVKGLKGKVILPDSIWCMEKLRHLHVNCHIDFKFHNDMLGRSLLLVNLVSFSSPSLAYGKHTKKILRRLPNLRKLRCIYLESWDAFTNYNKFPVLDFLVQLESLKILYIGRVLNAGELNLPWNLKKLTLSNFRLPWTHIANVGRLQNLQVLKLLSKAFDGERWDMREGEFLGLKYLKLDTLNIAQWNASNDHLPKLEQLVLHNCKDLEEVPLSFGEIPTLKKIEVQSCRLSTEESVRNISEQEIQGLKIIINQKIHF